MVLTGRPSPTIYMFLTLLITGAKPLAISASDMETVLEYDQHWGEYFTMRLLARIEIGLLKPAGLCNKHTEERDR